jgi:hypothetical protein
MTNLHHVKFNDLVKRHGIRPALELVKRIETLARIKNDVIPLDQEARFRKALAALSGAHYAA